MALTSCKECGGSVSTEARKCPHCGTPGPTREAARIRFWSSVLAAAVAVAVALIAVFALTHALGG